MLYPIKKELDITSKKSVKEYFKKHKPDVVLHLAAYTDVAKAEAEKKECFRVNVEGTRLLSVRSQFFIYMSTDYVFDGEKGSYHEGHIPNPVNFYSLTKLLGEYEAKLAWKHCIVRTSFKPRPFDHDFAATDIWLSGDYVDVIAKKVVLLLDNIETLPRTLHIGTERKSLFELALQTKKVQAIKRVSLPIRLPRDVSLDTTLWGMLNYEKLKRRD